MTSPSAVNLLVLRCRDIDLTKTFYENLGLSFKMEKHGDGPVQYSSNINGMIIELYPSLHGNMPDNSRLGFSYSSLEDTLSKLDKSISVGSIQQSGDRKFVVVKDPDGRNIELVQLRHSVSEAA